MSEIKSILLSKDINTLLIFNNSIKCRILDRIMPVVTHLGSAAATISTCLLIIILGKENVRLLGIKALFTLVVSHLLVQLLKNRVCRLRPKDALPDINTFNVALDYYSFPSGHTTAVFSIAAAVAFSIPLMAAVCFPVALIVAISRLYLGVHYPSDVLAGMGVAGFTSVIVEYIMNIL